MTWQPNICFHCFHYYSYKNTLAVAGMDYNYGKMCEACATKYWVLARMTQPWSKIEENV